VQNGRGAINDEAKQEDVTDATLSHVREVTMARMIAESVFMTVRWGVSRRGSNDLSLNHSRTSR